MANIYMVEDDTDYAGVVVKVLGSIGHRVEVEADPSRAIEHLKAKRPDMILLDVMFPEDSFAGLELARTLNRDPDFKNTPILLLTAVNEKYSMGFSSLDIDNSFFPVSDFLDKSVDLDVLKAKVTKMLGEKGKAV
jgi:CheY-like chemotaxis protein